MPAQTTSRISPIQVVAYNEDVWTWVYFDQIDHVLRYEAYVIDYQDNGEPGGLNLVLEEGLITDLEPFNMDSSVLAACLFGGVKPHQREASPNHQFPIWPHIEVNKTSLYFGQANNIYRRLVPREIAVLHKEFRHLETELKQRNKKRWKRRLRLLGFDVLDSAF